MHGFPSYPLLILTRLFLLPLVPVAIFSGSALLALSHVQTNVNTAPGSRRLLCLSRLHPSPGYGYTYILGFLPKLFLPAPLLLLSFSLSSLANHAAFYWQHFEHAQWRQCNTGTTCYFRAHAHYVQLRQMDRRSNELLLNEQMWGALTLIPNKHECTILSSLCSVSKFYNNIVCERK